MRTVYITQKNLKLTCLICFWLWKIDLCKTTRLRGGAFTSTQGMFFGQLQNMSIEGASVHAKVLKINEVMVTKHHHQMKISQFESGYLLAQSYMYQMGKVNFAGTLKKNPKTKQLALK